MDRALIGYLKKASSLLRAEWSFQDNLAFNLVQPSDFGFAIGAIFSVDPRVPQANRDLFQWPLLAFGVQSQRHRCAGSKRREQQLVRPRAGICASGADGLVGMKPVLPYFNPLRESGGTSPYHNRGTSREF